MNFMSQAENLKWLLKLCVVLPGIYHYLEIIFKEFNVEYKTLYIILPIIIKLKCTLSTGICRQDNLYFKTLRTSLNKILFYNVSTSLVFGETYYAKKVTIVIQAKAMTKFMRRSTSNNGSIVMPCLKSS